MMRVIIDFYPPPDDAFLAHIEEPDRDPSKHRDPHFAQTEWVLTAQLVMRLRKHLRRVGLKDRQNIDQEAAAALKLPERQDVEAIVGWSEIRPDKRKSKW